MKQSILKSCVSLAVLSIAGVSSAAFAQSATPAAQTDAAKPADTLSEIVVTASTGNKTKLNSSVSVSSVSSAQIANFNPTSDAELMRFLPGISVPGKGGPGGNANITIRGLTTPSGGTPFLQVQEDGLPLVLTGDMPFANNDYWTHFSPTDERVEAIRGGSASTLASQAVGGVVNYISKTSRSEGGYMQIEEGLNYNYSKISGLLSSSINDSTYYNVGGSFDIGHGTRHASWNVSDSYELKGNITKEFSDPRNYIRFYFKVADTQEPDYNAGLVQGNVSGNNISGFSAVPGFDYRDQAGTYSIFNRSWTIVNYDGTSATNANTQTINNNGITTRERLFQVKLHYNITDDILLEDNGRIGLMSGGFATGFYGATATSSLVGGTTAGGATIASFIYANGPNAGKAFTGAYVNSNTDIYTDIRNVNSTTNDLKLSDKFNLGGDAKLNLQGGWFYYNQHSAMDWHPNNTYSDGTTGNNPAMLDPVGTNGNLLAVNGQAGYNNNWGTGGCCAETYDLDYSINAPYADLSLDYGQFNLDGSIREEMFDMNGTQYSGGANSVGTMTVSQIDPRTGQTVQTLIPYGFAPDEEFLNFRQHATNWSVGGLYKITPFTSAFVRASHGVRFNADRAIGGTDAGGGLTQAGLANEQYPADQYEIGAKSGGGLGGGHYTLEATLFHTNYSISSFGVGSNCSAIDPNYTTATTCTLTNKFKDTGYEVFATYRMHQFNFVANLTGNFSTYTNAGSSASLDSALPKLSYALMASYNPTAASSIGLSANGNTSTPSYTGTTKITYPGSVLVGAFAHVELAKHLVAGLDVYNLFNAVAVQGGQPGLVAGTTNMYSATIADGRSVKGSIKFSF